MNSAGLSAPPDSTRVSNDSENGLTSPCAIVAPACVSRKYAVSERSDPGCRFITPATTRINERLGTTDPSAIRIVRLEPAAIASVVRTSYVGRPYPLAGNGLA